MARWRYAAEAAAASQLPDATAAPRELGELSFYLEDEGASGAAQVAIREIKRTTIMCFDYKYIKKILVEKDPYMTMAMLGDMWGVKVAEGDKDLRIATACNEDKVRAAEYACPPPLGLSLIHLSRTPPSPLRM